MSRKREHSQRSQAVALAFGRVLIEQRRRVGLSQEQLAARGDLDRTTPSLWERGLRQPTLSMLLRIAGPLQVSPATLVLRTQALLADE